MLAADSERALTILHSLIGKTLSSIECDEFHLELVFRDGSRFRTQCSWRVIQRDSLLIGGGDVGGQMTQDILKKLTGLKVASASISNYLDTDLRFENDFIVQVISDAVQFETWDAHLDVGWAIFSGGRITVFPPAPVAPTTAATS